MTPAEYWHLAMLCLLPFMLGGAKFRVWSVLFLANLATYVSWSTAWFLTVDLVAAALILIPPKADGQRAIGGIFALMAMFDIGYLLSPQQGVLMYQNVLIALGWAQWFILLLWGLHDAWRHYLSGFWVDRRVSYTALGRVR